MALLQKIDTILADEYETIVLDVPAQNGKLLSWLHQNAEVIGIELQNEQMHITAKIAAADNSRLQKILSQG